MPKVAFVLWSILILIGIYSTDAQSHQTERKAQELQAKGNYEINWAVSLGNQDSVLNSEYLKAGLEQSIKDYINLALKCKNNKANAGSAFHSISIDKMESISKKTTVIAGVGRCNGDRETCKQSLDENAALAKIKSSHPDVSTKSKDLCEQFEASTLFERFEKIFVSGLFFDSKADIEAMKDELERTLDLNYNYTFAPTKSDGLDVVRRVQLDVENITESNNDCAGSQCETQSSTMSQLFNHFGIEVDGNEHECKATGVNCDENGLVKYLFIGEMFEPTHLFYF